MECLGEGTHRGLLPFLPCCFTLVLSARVGFTTLYRQGALCRRLSDSRRRRLTLFKSGTEPGGRLHPFSFLSSTFQGRTCGRVGLHPAWLGSPPADGKRRGREGVRERGRNGGKEGGLDHNRPTSEAKPFCHNHSKQCLSSSSVVKSLPGEKGEGGSRTTGEARFRVVGSR